MCIFKLIKCIKTCAMCYFIIVYENHHHHMMNFIVPDKKSILWLTAFIWPVKCYENNANQPHWVTPINDLLLCVPVPSWLIHSSVTIATFYFINLFFWCWTLFYLWIVVHNGIYLRNKSWKPECVGSFNMGWQILVFYPEPEARDKIY